MTMLRGRMGLHCWNRSQQRPSVLFQGQGCRGGGGVARHMDQCNEHKDKAVSFFFDAFESVGL